MLSAFFAANQKVADKVERYLPQAKTNIFELYVDVISGYLNTEPIQVVVDVGGGKSCPFAKHKDPTKTKIIAVDLSEEELQYNRDVDEKRVADITKSLPFEMEEVDLIVSRSVLEHISDLENFVANSERVLRESGHFIHLFPSKFAPFALINQALPNSLARKILYFLRPDSKGILGFPAFYNRCYYSGIRRLVEEHNFEVVTIQLSYYQSSYFNFFLPLYLASALYEMVVRALGVKNLAAYVLLVARKNKGPL
jgi:SAM-dependent methyltransferase